MLRGGEGWVLTFGETGDGTRTGGWFRPARKPPAQNPDSGHRVREADFGGSTWFTPRPAAAEQHVPGDGLERGPMAFQGDAPAFQGGPPAFQGGAVGSQPAGIAGYRQHGLDDPGRPAPAFYDGGRHDQDLDEQDPRGAGGATAWREIPARGVTAANRWAEVTRGGTPAGVHPSRGPDGDGFPPSGFPPGRDLQEDDGWTFGADQGYTADGGSGGRRGDFAGAGPQDVPFRGARPIDVSAARNPQARRSPAYSPAAASASPGTAQRRPETGALRRIKESGAMRAIKDTTAMQMLRERYAGRGKALAITVACVFIVLAVVATLLVATHGG
jgi:hypothetical protein